MSEEIIPTSTIVAKPKFSWWVLIPVIIALLIILIILSALGSVGPKIQISFPEGHGLKTGDAVKYRGIIAGEITEVRFNDAQDGINVTVSLHPDASFLARSESRFWIVRPTLSISKISGADTIIGARYIAVAPGAGEKQKIFTGLAEEPPILERKPDALEIICQSDFRSGLRSGAPVLYRQIVIGRVLSVNLASDGSAIESRLYIEPRFTSLIRDNTEFWNASGFTFSGGIFGGLELSIDSLETLMTGGISLAVPNQPGKQAINGDRYILRNQPEEEWMHWNPSIELGSAMNGLYPSDIANVFAIKSTWTESSFWGTKNHEQNGYAVYCNNGVLGLASLLPEKAGNLKLHIEDNTYEPQEPTAQARGLALRNVKVPYVPWLSKNIRIPQQLEDAYAIKNVDTYKHIPVSKITKHENNWVCDVRDLDKSWHGCPVLSLKDKKLIGFLSVHGGGQIIVPMNGKIMECLMSLD